MKRSDTTTVLLAHSDLSGGVILSGNAAELPRAFHTTETIAEEIRHALLAGARKFRWRRKVVEVEAQGMGGQTGTLLKVEDLAVEVDRTGAWFMVTFVTREPMSFFLQRASAMALLDSLDQCFSENMNDKWTAGING